MTSVNLCKPIYDIKSYSTFICPFECGKCEKERTKIQNFKNKNRFLDEKRAFLYRLLVWVEKLENVFFLFWA